MSTKEATTRFKLNRLLEPAGWWFYTAGDQPENIWLEPSAATGNAAFYQRDSFAIEVTIPPQATQRAIVGGIYARPGSEPSLAPPHEVAARDGMGPPSRPGLEQPTTAKEPRGNGPENLREDSG